MKGYWIAPAAALCATAPVVAQAPTGLDALGQVQAVAPAPADAGFHYRRLRNGVQFTLGGVTKSLIFYAPGVVRVSANLGKSYWTARSLEIGRAHV